MESKNNKSGYNYDVIVIGGGASGMMAVSVAAKRGKRVLLIEKNRELGRKLSITGGGRCNILNDEDNHRLLLANYGKSNKPLFSAFDRFGMQETKDYFASIGIRTKTEARKRAFPVSESAIDVVAALSAELRKYRVTVITGRSVKRLVADDNKISNVIVDDSDYTAGSYILATGGTSRPETGSSGDGFKWLEDLGHSVRPPSPNVTPLALSETWVTEVSGTTMEDIGIVFYSEGVRSFKLNGSVLFTHFGISGPTILNNAYRVAELLEQGSVEAKMDCFPKLDNKQLDDQVQETLKAHPSKMTRSTMRYIAPPGFAKLFVKLLEDQIDLATRNSELRKEDRQKIVNLLKELPLNITNLMGFDKAVVADGGVSLKEIDTRTMRSRVVDNLYITGDLLDINRPSGGYSLQLCWTTGFLAGSNANR